MGELKGCLQTILREEAVAPGPNDEGLVTSSEESGTSMHVQISHVPSTTTVVSLQQESQYSVLRKAPGKSWRRKCDFILVDEDAGDCKVVMVELKSTLGESQYGLEQLRRSLPMAKYILTACEVELQRSWPCRFSYALIAEKLLHKTLISKAFYFRLTSSS